LARPHEWRRCTLLTTGCTLLLGFGGFALYLAAVQNELEARGIDTEIKKGTRDKGLYRGPWYRDFALLWLGLWFCTVNPVLEELFWRGYAYAEIGRILNRRAQPVDDGVDEQAAALNPESPGGCDGDDDDGGKPRDASLLNGADQSGLSRWLTSAYFASFHGVVCGVFVDPKLAFAVAVFIGIGGRIWIWLGERAPFGFPFVVAFHAGCDVAIVLFVSACDFGWTRHEAYRVALGASAALAAVGAAFLAVAWRGETFPDPPCAFLARGAARPDRARPPPSQEIVAADPGIVV